MNVNECLGTIARCALQVEPANLRLVSKNLGAPIRMCTGVPFCYHDVGRVSARGWGQSK
jgi:hypothetical protein